jgi:hypothetical protein
MYTDINFKTKKALKEAVRTGKVVQVYQPNDMFGVTAKVQSGSHMVTVEGPHYPAAHSWYASVDVENGRVVRVR